MVFIFSIRNSSTTYTGKYFVILGYKLLGNILQPMYAGRNTTSRLLTKLSFQYVMQQHDLFPAAHVKPCHWGKDKSRGKRKYVAALLFARAFTMDLY